MCGIAGIINFNRRPIEFATLQAMADLIAHRGPDDMGYLTLSSAGKTDRGRVLHSLKEGWLGFAHRRLSILDLSPTGWQPLQLTDPNYSITYNGEIYNYIELREELQRVGFSFFSQSDTEVILAAYAHWGTDAFRRLNGMFGCAILDLNKNKLVLARDPFGIKPLYYCNSAGSVAFASEIKALLASKLPSRRLNAQRLFEYLRLAQSDSGEQTFFEDVQQLPAAHFMEIDLERGTIDPPKCYWKLQQRPAREISFSDAAEELREQFIDNVRLHMRSDVPLGAALSGGIDSSSIVMAMRHLGGPDFDIHTFSFVPGDEKVSEAHWINLVEKISGVIQHRIQPGENVLLEELDKLVVVQEEPFGSTSILAQHLVYRGAHEAGIKVVLDGQGADEQIAGYPNYYPARISSLLSNWEFSQAQTLVNNIAANGPIGSRKLWLRAIMDKVPVQLHNLGRKLSGHPTMPAWMDKSWFYDREVHMAWAPGLNTGDRLRNHLRQDITRTSLPLLLRWQDRNSMAYSVESRVPFLTVGMVEKSLSYPEQYLIDDNGTLKAVFRHAMRGLVPDQILDRRDKVAFATPEQAWLRALRPWFDDILHGERSLNLPFFCMDEIRREWDRAIEFGSCDPKIWRWISLIKWMETFEIEY